MKLRIYRVLLKQWNTIFKFWSLFTFSNFKNSTTSILSLPLCIFANFRSRLLKSQHYNTSREFHTWQRSSFLASSKMPLSVSRFLASSISLFSFRKLHFPRSPRFDCILWTMEIIISVDDVPVTPRANMRASTPTRCIPLVIINSLDEKFPEFVAHYLINYWLYKFYTVYNNVNDMWKDETKITDESIRTRTSKCTTQKTSL